MSRSLKLMAAALVVALGMSGCKRFDAGEQPNSRSELLTIIQSAPACRVTNDVVLHAARSVKGESEYILTVQAQGGETVPIRLFKDSFTMGGYRLSGVSHDGHWRVLASVNHLAEQGADVTLDALEHYKDGLTQQDKYAFCAGW